MLIKYTDLHNKILRDAADPDKIAQELLDNGYYIVGVNVHNDGLKLKGQEHFYKLFETHFELFEQKGLLILPSIEIKIRNGDYSKLPMFIEEFSRRYIPIHHKGDIHHVPFIIMVHGGAEHANKITATHEKANILCHPGKDEGYFSADIASDAAKNGVGMEINYREYRTSDDRNKHMDQLMGMVKLMRDAGDKLFLCTASIREEELVHIRDLVDFGRQVHADIVEESMKNTYELVRHKYDKLFQKIEFSMESFKEKHKDHI